MYGDTIIKFIEKINIIFLKGILKINNKKNKLNKKIATNSPIKRIRKLAVIDK